MSVIPGILLVAAAATAGDYVWYTFGVQHSLTAGLVHGVLLLSTVGVVIGAASGHPIKGLPIGAIAGLAGAASYYAIVAVTGGRTYDAAIPAAWVITWIALAALEGRWLQAPARRTWGAVAARGVVAATVGGVAFYLVQDTLWGRPPAGGRNYLVQYLAWAVAWTPGLVALTWGASPRRRGALPAPADSQVPREPQPEPPADMEVDVTISGAELLARIDRGECLAILDVRSEAEFSAGHVPGAVNVPFTQVLSRLSEIPGAPEDDLFVYCGHGPRAYMAAVALRRGGRARIVYVSGHWAAWRGAGLRVEQ